MLLRIDLEFPCFIWESHTFLQISKPIIKYQHVYKNTKSMRRSELHMH